MKTVKPLIVIMLLLFIHSTYGKSETISLEMSSSQKERVHQHTTSSKVYTRAFQFQRYEDAIRKRKLKSYQQKPLWA